MESPYVCFLHCIGLFTHFLLPLSCNPPSPERHDQLRNAYSAEPNHWNADRSIYNYADNIDYNSLKHFIKAHTTKGEARAIAIPGQPDTHLAKVENELFHELCAQHGRAGLFVTAKADEINRRLRTCRILLLSSPVQ